MSIYFNQNRQHVDTKCNYSRLRKQMVKYEHKTTLLYSITDSQALSSLTVMSINVLLYCSQCRKQSTVKVYNYYNYIYEEQEVHNHSQHNVCNSCPRAGNQLTDNLHFYTEPQFSKGRKRMKLWYNVISRFILNDSWSLDQSQCLFIDTCNIKITDISCHYNWQRNLFWW